MLNELAQLAASLRACGIPLPPSHPSVYAPGRAEALWVRLDSQARIHSIAHLPAERMVELWTVREGKQNSFPRVVVQDAVADVDRQHSLRKALTSEGARDVGAVAEVLRRSLAEISHRPNARFDALWSRLRKRAEELLLVLTSGSKDIEAFRALLVSVAQTRLTGSEFLEELASKSVTACLDGRLDCIDLVVALVLGRNQKKTGGKISAEVPLFFDVAEAHTYLLPVAHPEMGRHVAAALAASETDAGTQGTCALTGARTSLVTKMFPAPKLPGLGETYLLSMNEDTPCQTRYGATGTRVLPVGRGHVADVENAVKWIVDKTRVGRTWQHVPSARRGEQDLLVAYLVRLPALDAELAGLFSVGMADKQNVALEGRFEAISRDVLKALKAQPAVTQTDEVRLLVLSKVDPGRRQIALAREFDVSTLVAAAREWLLGCSRNLPPVHVPFPNGKAPTQATPPVLFPDEPVRILGKQWLRAGAETQDVRSCLLHEAFDLFLPPVTGCRSTAQRLLRLQIQRASSLLAALGHGNAREREKGRLGRGNAKGREKGLNFAARAAGLKHVSLMGTLLFRLGRRKEVYMNEPAFKLGEMLALADGLHGDYCRTRRKGQYPPQLIGNALLPIASSAPARALARLAERLRIYQAWAATAQGADVGLVKGRLSRFGEVSRELHAVGVPERLDDAGKAELLLGYLARPAKSERSAESNEQTQSGGQDNG